MAETSGIRARPDISYEFPTPNRRRALPSIIWKWASPTLPASRFAFPPLRTGLCLKRYGAQGSFDIKFPHETENICDTPGGAAVFKGSATPIPLSPEDRTRANAVYDRWAQSIDSYEQSVQVSAFSSKFDAFLAGKYKLTADEMAGYKLFDGKGNCNSCHLDGRGTTLKSASGHQCDRQVNPLFTCFGSANEGVPLNPRDAFYYETKPDSYGFTPNPYGFGYRDLGLGTFLRSGFGSGPNPN